MKKNNYRHISKFAEYAFIRILIFFFQLLPFRLNVFITKIIGSILHKVLGKKRKLIEENLKYAFPERSDEWIQKTAQKNFIHTARMAAEFVCLPLLQHPAFFKKWVKFEPNLEEHQRILRGGGIFIMGHIGSWEWNGQIASIMAGEDIYTFARKQSNPWFNDYIERVRGLSGMRLLYVDESPLKAISLLRSKKAVGFISDQYAVGGEYVPFMNRLASTFLGPASFARISSAPVYFASSYHNQKGQLVFEMETVGRPKKINSRKSRLEWERSFTLSWIRLLENKIRERPTDYFWVHNRWKNPPENTEEILRMWEKY